MGQFKNMIDLTRLSSFLGEMRKYVIAYVGGVASKKADQDVVDAMKDKMAVIPSGGPEWTSGVTANYNEVWRYDGSVWLCRAKLGTTAAPSLTNTEWLLLVSKGADGKDSTGYRLRGLVRGVFDDRSDLQDAVTQNTFDTRGLWLIAMEGTLCLVDGSFNIVDQNPSDGDAYVAGGDGDASYDGAFFVFSDAEGDWINMGPYIGTGASGGTMFWMTPGAILLREDADGTLRGAGQDIKIYARQDSGACDVVITSIQPNSVVRAQKVSDSVFRVTGLADETAVRGTSTQTTVGVEIAITTPQGTVTVSNASIPVLFVSYKAVKDVVQAEIDTLSNKVSTLDGNLDALRNDLDDVINGNEPVALADNLTSWDGLNSQVEDVFSDAVRTTAGDTSIISDKGGVLKSIVAKDDFAATAFRATGFNLLRDAVAVGSGYYFLVPALPFGTYGTAQQPNGVLFTNSSGQNMRPSVYFRPLSQGVPTSITNGTLCSYTDSNGLRFYNTSQAGFLIVSGITKETTCAHIGWSRRYNEYISISDANDAGSTLSLTAILTAVHSDVKQLLSLGSISDRIDFASGTATWKRSVGITTPTWTTEEDENNAGQYVHTANISDMKADGIAMVYGSNSVMLSVDGTLVSYTDTNEDPVSALVKYELASPVTGTASLQNTYALEDWGLEKFLYITGSAYVTTQYTQGITDTLAAVAATHMPDATQRIEDLEYEQETEDIVDYDEMDLECLPLLCGQPMKLYGAGTPQNAIVPDNWRQLADGGYDWNGTPSALGQEYVDTANNGKYEAVRDGAYGLKWMAV